MRSLRLYTAPVYACMHVYFCSELTSRLQEMQREMTNTFTKQITDFLGKIHGRLESGTLKVVQPKKKYILCHEALTQKFGSERCWRCDICLDHAHAHIHKLIFLEGILDAKLDVRALAHKHTSARGACLSILDA